MRRRLLVLAALAAALPSAVSAAGGGGEDKKKLTGGSSYVPISTVVGTTVRADGRRGVLTVECGLDVPDSNLRGRAQNSIPRLRSAYASTIQAYAAGLPANTPPNAEFIARALQRQTDVVLGRPGARLLLGAILVN